MFNLVIKVSDNNLLKDNDDETFEEAIQSIYDFDDCVVMNTGENSFSMCMKDFGDIWHDVMKMISSLEKGERVIEMIWASQSFWGHWIIEDTDNILKISTKGYVFQKDGMDIIFFVKREEFLHEWKNVKNRIISDLINKGYDINLFE